LVRLTSSFDWPANRQILSSIMKIQTYFVGLVVAEEALAELVRPDVPAWLNTDLFRIPDDRTFQERRAYASHNCTYPSDPMKLQDLHKRAQSRANAGEHDSYVTSSFDGSLYQCDRCLPGSRAAGAFAWFCTEEDNSRYVNFTRAAYGAKKTGQACWIPDSALAGSKLSPSLDMGQQIGLEHGVVIEPTCYVRDRQPTVSTPLGLNCYYQDDPTPIPPGLIDLKAEDLGCSQEQPPDACAVTPGWERVCKCDENCNIITPSSKPDCCTKTERIETFSVYYKWYVCTVGDYGPECGSFNKVV